MKLGNNTGNGGFNMKYSFKFSSLAEVGVILLIMFACFMSPLMTIIDTKYLFLLYIVIVILCSLPLVYPRVYLKKNALYVLMPWFVLFIMFLLKNEELLRGNYVLFIRGLVGFLLLFVLTFQNGWNMTAYKAIVLSSFIHVVATFFFLIFPTLWGNYALFVFGAYPAGTSKGNMGYTAALNGHYSTNGTLIAFAVLGIMASLMSKKKKTSILLMIIAIVSLLLTTKRAHLLFSIIAFIIVYFIVKWKEGAVNSILKTIVILILGYMSIEIAIRYFPVLNNVFERFSTIGTDAESITRLLMWNTAFQYFEVNPIIGIGWDAFKYRVVSVIPSAANTTMNAHNIYIQLLAETGIVGFTAFCCGAFSSIVANAKILFDKGRYEITNEKYGLLVFSEIFQVFFLLYGLSGNFLYDFSFLYYIVTVAVGYSIRSTLLYSRNSTS